MLLHLSYLAGAKTQMIICNFYMHSCSLQLFSKVIKIERPPVNWGDFVQYGHFLFYSFKPATDGTQKPTSTDRLRSHLSNHIMFAFVSAGI